MSRAASTGWVLLAVAVAAGCAGDDGDSSDEMILATTTSTVDSGLLDELLPAYEDAGGCGVKALGIGSGEALELGASGNADALLVHSPAAEQDYMAAGDGSRRELVMHNDFVLVGAADDPADVASAPSAVDAMARIDDSGATFVSRADESGTNTKELGLWERAGVEPSGDDYVETGQGMGETLTIASQLGAYTLSDRGSYLATLGLDLEVLSRRSDDLLNVYHVVVVDHEGTSTECADGFADWLLTPQTQQLIGEFGVDEYGQQLFHPDAGS